MIWSGCAAQLGWPDHQVDISLELDAFHQRQTLDRVGHAQVRLDELGVSIWSVALERCDGDQPSAAATRLPQLLGTSLAVAHGAGGPATIAEPLVVQLAPGDSRIKPVGTLQPPSDRYCGLRVLIKAADSDARELDRMVTMKDHSTVARGAYATDGAWEPFDWTSTRTVERVFEFDEPLEFDTDDSRPVSISIDLRARSWFEGVDFTASADDAQAAFLRNIRTKPVLEVER
jgi:hypothetical protein